MPILALSLGLDGPRIAVGVSVPKGPASPGRPPGTWGGLIDTGADMTAISPRVVAALRPMQIGVQVVGRPGGGNAVCATYEARVRFGGHTMQGRWFGLEVVEAQPATAGVDVLIGMDLLLRIDMTWLGRRRLLLLNY